MFHMGVLSLASSLPAAREEESAEVGDVGRLGLLWVVHTRERHEPEIAVPQDQRERREARVVVETLWLACLVGRDGIIPLQGYRRCCGYCRGG